MTFPIQHPLREYRFESGQYRGFYVSVTTENTSDSDHLPNYETTLYIQSPVPMPQISIARHRYAGPGGIALGDPDFDHHFVMYGDVELVRYAMNADMVTWIKSIDWDSSALSRPNGIEKVDFRTNPIEICGAGSPLVCQCRVDFVIDFLLRIPKDAWPVLSSEQVRPA